MVSFIGFIISMDSIPARVALLVTQFLTQTNILIAQQVYKIVRSYDAFNQRFKLDVIEK